MRRIKNRAKKKQQHKNKHKHKPESPKKLDFSNKSAVKTDRKKLLVFGYMRTIHNEMMQIPMDVINLCLLFYYIPYYSAEIRQCKTKTFILKHFQFQANIICNPLTNVYEYNLSLIKRGNKKIHYYFLESNSIGLITLYHELVLPAGDIIDINIATFTYLHTDFKLEFKLLHSELNFVTMNTKIIRIGESSYKATSPYAKYMKYTEFNPYGSMSAKCDINCRIMDIKKYVDVTNKFSPKFDNNYWCLKYELEDKYVVLRLLSLPIGIEKIKVKCILNSKHKMTKLLRLFDGENQCRFYVDCKTSGLLEFKVHIVVLELHGVHAKINKKKWMDNRVIQPRMGIKFITFDS